MTEPNHVENNMKTLILNKIEEIKNKFRNEAQELENDPQPLTIKGAVYVVAGLHVAVIVGIMLFSSASKARATAAEDKKFLETAPMVGVDEPKVEVPPKIEPKPVAVVIAKPTPVPRSMLQTKIVDKKDQNPSYPQYKREYVVQQGDSFYKIVKKYRVSAKKLQVLNNIKDPNKIAVGQKLKLM